MNSSNRYYYVYEYCIKTLLKFNFYVCNYYCNRAIYKVSYFKYCTSDPKFSTAQVMNPPAVVQYFIK